MFNPILTAKATFGGEVGMNSQFAWQIFLDTGSPEMYLLYNKVKKMENRNVLEDQRPGITGNKVQ